MQSNDSLSIRVITTRRRLGLTQAEVGARVGLTQGIVSKIERGAATNPGWETICAIEAALDLKHGELTRGLYFPPWRARAAG